MLTFKTNIFELTTMKQIKNTTDYMLKVPLQLRS